MEKIESLMFYWLYKDLKTIYYQILEIPKLHQEHIFIKLILEYIF